MNSKKNTYNQQNNMMEQEHEMTPEQIMCTEDIYESIIISLNRFIYAHSSQGKEWLKERQLKVIGQEHKKYPENTNFCLKQIVLMIGNLADCMHEITGYQNKNKFIQYLEIYKQFNSERLQELLIILNDVLNNDFEGYNQYLFSMQSQVKSQPKEGQVQIVAQKYVQADYKVTKNMKQGHSFIGPIEYNYHINQQVLKSSH